MGLGRRAIWALAFGFGIGQSDSAAALAPQHPIAAVDSAANDDRIPAVAILLDNAAGVSPTTMRKAEAIATSVFRQAGVKVHWINCSFSEAERQDPPGCQLSLDVPTIIATVLPDTARRRGLPVDRLGFCLNKAVYLLTPGIRAIAEQEGFPIWLVLGLALVHETGHALLGPGHSKGVMRPDFRKAEWMQAERGQLLFVSNDAHRIREKLVKLVTSK
jgi:hypothetical protein